MEATRGWGSTAKWQNFCARFKYQRIISIRWVSRNPELVPRAIPAFYIVLLGVDPGVDELFILQVTH